MTHAVRPAGEPAAAETHSLPQSARPIQRPSPVCGSWTGAEARVEFTEPNSTAGKIIGGQELLQPVPVRLVRFLTGDPVQRGGETRGHVRIAGKRINPRSADGGLQIPEDRHVGP